MRGSSEDRSEAMGLHWIDGFSGILFARVHPCCEVHVVVSGSIKLLVGSPGTPQGLVSASKRARMLSG